MAFISFQPSDFFNSKRYAGNGSTQSITGVGFQPDFTWIKSITGGYNHYGFDSVRGVKKWVSPSQTTAETAQDPSLNTFDSDGFALGAWDNINENTYTHVGYCWKESAVSGTDIVTYTGNGSARDISHSAGAAPHWMMVKNTSGSDRAWNCYHDGLGADKRLFINTNESVSTASTAFTDAPTASVMKLGTNVEVNEDTLTYVAYVFAPIQGFSKFGSYLGNNSTDGVFLFCGFRPAFLMVKCSSHGSSNWTILDNKRSSSGGGNPNDKWVYANTNDAEVDQSSNPTDFLSNGFKMRNNGGYLNASGRTYMFIAFAEAPFVNSNGVPCNAR